MSEILGFGVNSYRNYEAGEVPGQSNARLIQFAGDTKKFKNLVELSEAIEGESYKKLIKKIDQLVEDEEKTSFTSEFQDSTGEQFKQNENRKFNPDLFNETELNVLEEIKERFADVSTSDMIELSHKEEGWKKNYNNGKKLISYKYGFDLNQI